MTDTKKYTCWHITHQAGKLKPADTCDDVPLRRPIPASVKMTLMMSRTSLVSSQVYCFCPQTANPDMICSSRQTRTQTRILGRRNFRFVLPEGFLPPSLWLAPWQAASGAKNRRPFFRMLDDELWTCKEVDLQLKKKKKKYKVVKRKWEGNGFATFLEHVEVIVV